MRLIEYIQSKFDGDISIHASAWDATPGDIKTLSYFCDFNPRIRVGCDVFLLPVFPSPVFISIHASAWDATSKIQVIHPRLIISIHASAWDATNFNFCTKIRYRFQSTHPRGMRLHVLFSFAFLYAFQSTHPRGMRREKVL